jgi:predicted nucleic-acid-binding protein
MIGVDTNVLLRLYVADDLAQHRAAVSFFRARSDADPAFIRLIVFVEFVWSLRKTYGYSNKIIMGFVTLLLDARDILLEREDVIAGAVVEVERQRVGLVDALIALANKADGCSTTVTFDKIAARRIAAMELLS